jgi:tetratricopeptide (TPR) repeat protein
VEDTTDALHADPSRHRGEEQQTIDRLWDFADPAASEERFRAVADDESGTLHERAVMTTQVARAVGIQRRDDDALALLDELEAAERPDETPEEAAELRARIALERGRIAATAERFDEAVPLFTKAVREAAVAGSTFLVLDALHMLALNDAGHEEEWATEGFDILDGVRDPRLKRWGVALHNNLGWTKHDGGDAQAALYHFQKAVDAADRYGTAGQQHVARWSVGRALRSLGRNDEALELQRELARARPDDTYVQAEIEALEAATTEAEPTIEP